MLLTRFKSQECVWAEFMINAIRACKTALSFQKDKVDRRVRCVMLPYHLTRL